MRWICPWFVLVVALGLTGLAWAESESESEAESEAEAETEAETETETETERVEPPALIPRDVLFGNPYRSQARISPDGARISYLAPVDGVMNVWVGPADEPDAAQPVTSDTGRGIRSHGWAFTSDHVFYSQDRDGDENWHLYRIRLSDGDVLDLTPIDGIQARTMGKSADQPGILLVGINDRDPRHHDPYRVDVDSGKRKRLFKNKDFAGFHVDHQLQIRLGEKVSNEGGGEVYVLDKKGRGEMLMSISQEDSLTTAVVGFDASGESLYMIDSRGRDTAAFTTYDLATGEIQVLAEDPRADIDGVIMHPTEHTPLLATSTYERTETHLLADWVGEHIEVLEKVEPGDMNLAGCTQALDRCMVGFERDTGGPRYYLYDLESRTAEFLFAVWPDLDTHTLAPMFPVVVEARDGLSLVSYYSLPTEADPDGDGHPEQPLPTVLFVHGGPWGRDQWGYKPVHQWIANRGAVALSVNFRASTGFGKAFINAGDREWGAAAHDDLLDAVAWAVEQGISDPDRIAIAGGSYGGYATLVGLTFTPEVFVAGVDLVGPSNLVTLLESIPPYWAPLRRVFAARVGDVETDEGRAFLTERSPISRVDAIQRPLLIGQGANDPRVNQAESDQIVEAMKAKGLPVTYLLYPDEGHGFARPENTISFFAVTEAFLSTYLGTRFEPLGDDLEGSSMQVLEGADQVPGLAPEAESETESGAESGSDVDE